ncbi:MAG: TonB family protein [Caldimonas sp.]
MSGTLMRPAAVSFQGAVVGAANSRRLAVAALTAIALHGAVLAIRSGAPASNSVAPATAPVMAIRIVPPAPSGADASTGPQVTPAVAPAEVPPPPAAERARAQSVPPPPATATAAAMPTAIAPRNTPVESASRPAPTVGTSEAKGADTPLAAAPDYALGVRLDPGPRPLEDIEPEYPDMTHLREGVVVLRLLISDTGRVDNVAVVRAEPRGIFEQAALDAFSKARFSPGLAAGTPVKSQITVEVQFMPINRGARVSGRTY